MSLVVLVVVATGRSEEARDKKWRLQAGWVHQWGRGMEVSGPAPSYYNSLISRGGGPREGIPAGWNYNDGYVFPDEQSDVYPGGDPENPLSTHNWHYKNTSQYNSTDPDYPTLTFHRDLGLVDMGAPTVSGATSDDSFQSEGIEVKASRWLYTWEDWGLDLDLVLGLAWFPDTQTMRNNRTTEQNVSQTLATYTYNDFFGSSDGGNWQPPLSEYGPDSANYGPGGYYGGFYTLPDGDNPLIPLTPLEGRENTPGVIRDTAQIRGNLWRLRGEIGPTLTKPLTHRLSAYVSPQFALEFVDVCVRRTETVTLTANGETSHLGARTHHKDETTFVPGVLLTAGTDYLISDNWYVGGSLGWEWLSRDVKVRLGPDQVQFDLEGGELNLYLGRKF